MKTENISGLEIFSTGAHGRDFYTTDDLQQIVSSHGRLGFHAPLILDEGNAQRAFGAPALGFVERLYVRGGKLLADFANVPKKIAELIKTKAYKKLGTQIYWNYHDAATERQWPRVLKAITVSADGIALDTLADISALYDNRHLARAYDQEQHFRSYELEDTMNMNQNPAPHTGGLTIASRNFAMEALQYAQDHDLDFPSAVRTLMQRSRKTYAAPLPEQEIANVAKSVAGHLKIDYLTALAAVAREHPSAVRQIAAAWIVERAKVLARNKPGLWSDNESAALIEALRENQEIAEARHSGKLSENALRTLFGIGL